MPANPLQSLRDVHLPEPISAWPPAPGWYIVIALALVLFFTVAIVLYKRYQKNALRRLALRELNALQDSFEHGTKLSEIAPHISCLLRQVALAYFPKNKIAGLIGEEWLDFLSEHSACDFRPYEALLTKAPYQRQTNKASVEKLFALSKKWMQTLNV